MTKLFTFVVFCALVSGCSSPSSHVVTGEVREAIPTSKVVVYETLPEQYSEIAVLTASSKGSYSLGGESLVEDVMRSLRAEAAALGANGVILTSLYDDAANETITTFDGHQSGKRDVVKYYKRAQALAVFIE